MRTAPALVLVLLLAWAPPAARALPDLAPEIYDVAIDRDASVDPADVTEGCAGATTGRTLVRFGFRTHNVGDEPEVIGDPGCPSPCVDFPNAICANPEFVCSPLAGHNHPHFASFAVYELLDMHGNVLTRGGKRGFCLQDDASCSNGTYSCTDQGISPGCFDDYHPTLACQYIDATDVPGIGTRAFRVRGTSDPLELLVDADRSNNTTEVVIPGCGDGVVQDGEACDPGVPGDGVCCDQDCHPIPGCDASCAGRPAGALCRPATGPCDVAETCDGVSPACPLDAGLADGVACGAPSDGCIATVCRAGACVAERARGGCLVATTCYPAAAVDPGNDCQVCDPALSIDVFSPDHEPTPKGIECQLGRVHDVSQGIGCPDRVTHRMVTRLARAQQLADRLAAAPAPAARRIEARLLRVSHRLSALLTRGARHGCRSTGALAEIDALIGQLRGMRAETR
jgi:hypothetical protein